MSKLKINRRQIILDKALEMFNERGIEYVGLRELAAILNMRVSNITYYFPTKDDLVYELAQQLSAANATLIKAKENLTMAAFLDNLRSVFHNHTRFRCLLLSVVHLNRQNVHLAAEYRKTQTKRNAALTSNLRELIRGGYLLVPDENDLNLLVSGISLINRFWISEAAVSYRQLTIDAHIRHYLALIAKLLLPYATARGKTAIDSFSA